MNSKQLIIISSFYIIFATNVFSFEYKIIKIASFESPWGMSFINKNNLLITERKGDIILYNIESKKKTKINHNLNYLVDGQGGLLDILFNKNIVFISYSENRGNGKTSTSIARGTIKNYSITFRNIFRAEPPIKSGYHFGSRMQIRNEYLFSSIGERGKGMIAQDYTKHPGSIIKIHLNGDIPINNPRFINKKNWLPEIYQIGVRNPQGMTLSQFDNEIYITNHGAKGGDWFGKIKKSGNYGWKNLGWGGINYIGTKIGPAWKEGYEKALHYWVPSIGVSSLVIYKGKEFNQWNGKAIITALKDQSLRVIDFKNKTNIKEKIIFKNKIGRIRDIEVVKDNGKILLLTENALWSMHK